MSLRLLSSRVSESNAVSELMLDAKASDREKRLLRRTPYLKPATLQLDTNPSDEILVFTRDISEKGVGMLHLKPLDPQAATLSIELETGKLVELPIRIIWGLACGGPWYISGAEFCET